MLNPPYLLFYPDRNNDDVPDGDPEVHLQGFGLEDTHSVVNSLCWGPDGWLYAAQGSTVTGHVSRPGLDAGKEPHHSMGQLIWRYHPETRRYEVFAEGGGNAFGVEIDAKGRIYSGHNGGDTRGFHYVQGAYYQKGFNKHGPLSNPYAFGYFPAMKHNRVPRFTHTFVIYEADALPQPYRGLLFGVAPLLNHVVMSRVLPDGSSFQTRDIGLAVSSTTPGSVPSTSSSGPTVRSLSPTGTTARSTTTAITKARSTRATEDLSAQGPRLRRRTRHKAIRPLPTDHRRAGQAARQTPTSGPDKQPSG